MGLGVGGGGGSAGPILNDKSKKRKGHKLRTYIFISKQKEPLFEKQSFVVFMISGCIDMFNPILTLFGLPSLFCGVDSRVILL